MLSLSLQLIAWGWGVCRPVVGRVYQFRFLKSFDLKQNLAKQKQLRFVLLQFRETPKKNFASFRFVSFASFR